jgi:hypothetical protein
MVNFSPQQKKKGAKPAVTYEYKRDELFLSLEEAQCELLRRTSPSGGCSGGRRPARREDDDEGPGNGGTSCLKVRRVHARASL